MLFRDKVVIEVASGRGGDGVISFRREKYVPLGGPDGGDGGPGGSVYLVASAQTSHLGHINRRHYRATKGAHGSGSNRTGHSGDDVELAVPVGTQVWECIDTRHTNTTNTVKDGFGGSGVDAEPNINTLEHDINTLEHNIDTLEHDINTVRYDTTSNVDLPNLGTYEKVVEKVERGKRYRLVYDLAKEERFCIAKGGRGGAGNARYATSTNRAPRFRKLGEPGVSKIVQLRLRLAAEFGLLGAPNAGKSSVLSAITNATPEVAPYAFTTINPQIGITSMQVSVIDTPGLIAGAAANKGLGHAFLDHIAKCNTLACVLDITDNPESTYAMLLNELKAYDGTLVDRVKLVVLNKVDLVEKPVITDYGVETVVVSALTGHGMDTLTQRMRRLIEGTGQDQTRTDIT